MTGYELLDPVGRYAGIFVTTIIGAYVGSYLRKKAENDATHQNIRNLVEEMAAVTTATKKIEAAISDDVWGRQRRWELRRDTMLQAMDEIVNIQGPLSALTAAAVSLRMATDESEKTTAQKRVKEASGALELAMPNLFKSIHRIQVVCSADVEQQYRNVQALMFTAYHMIAKDNADEALRMTEDIGRATELAQAAIRRELGVDTVAAETTH